MRDVMRFIGLGFALGVCFAVLFFFLSLPAAHGRDIDGKYANSHLKPWFEALRSQRGLCCSFADGVTLDSVDWDVRDGKYRVRVCAKPPEQNTADAWAKCANKDWVEVPDTALITEPNKFGAAVVWPYSGYANLKTEIRCFIPGAGT